MEELISVVVTSYNHLEFLPQRMDSLLSQTYPNVEIIVVDDCSTDGSREFLKQFEINPKVRLFFQEKNNGYVHTSNFGVSQSKGEFIVFAECDDFAEPEQIETLYRILSKHQNVGVAFSCSNLVDQNSNFTGLDFKCIHRNFRNFASFDRMITRDQMQKLFLYSNVIPNMSAAMFKKALFEKVEGLSDKYKLSADWDFWMRLAEISDFYYVKKPLNNFRKHSTTIRNYVGKSCQLIEMVNLIAPIAKSLNLSFKEKISIKINFGSVWLYYAKENFPGFVKTFSKVWYGCRKQEPLLLFFLLLSLPVVSIRKIGNYLNFIGRIPQTA